LANLACRLECILVGVGLLARYPYPLYPSEQLLHAVGLLWCGVDEGDVSASLTPVRAGLVRPGDPVRRVKHRIGHDGFRGPVLVSQGSVPGLVISSWWVSFEPRERAGDRREATA